MYSADAVSGTDLFSINLFPLDYQKFFIAGIAEFIAFKYDAH